MTERNLISESVGARVEPHCRGSSQPRIFWFGCTLYLVCPKPESDTAGLKAQPAHGNPTREGRLAGREKRAKLY